MSDGALVKEGKLNFEPLVALAKDLVNQDLVNQLLLLREGFLQAGFCDALVA